MPIHLNTANEILLAYDQYCTGFTLTRETSACAMAAWLAAH